MLKFFPVPDPAFPYTLTRENIAAAQAMGIMHNGFSMYIGTLEHFGLDSKGGGLETLPADDDFVLEDGSFAGKFWADRYNVPEHYVYLDRGEAGPNGPVIRGLQVSPSNSEAGGFSDLSFTVYQNFAGRFYREFAELMNAWGGVPASRQRFPRSARRTRAGAPGSVRHQARCHRPGSSIARPHSR